MESGEAWPRNVIKLLSDIRTVLFGASILATLLGPPTVAVMGYLEGIPLAYIVVLAVVVATCGIIISDRVSAWITRTRGDYAYTLAYEGVSFGFNETNILNTLQVGVNLRNMCGHPTLYRVKRFDVVIGTRTLANPQFDSTGGFIPRAASRNYRYPPFPRSAIEEFLGKDVESSISFEIEYGHPDSKPVRLLTMRISIFLKLSGTPGCVDSIISEKDVRL